MFEKIIDFYKKIPNHGLYKYQKKDFEVFVSYFKDKTKDLPDLVLLKKKLELEKLNKIDTIEYKIILDKIKQLGFEYKKIGEDFENNSFNRINSFVNEFVKKNNIDGKIKILKNKTLYEKSENDWIIVGEVDLIVILKKENINYILFIGEIKHNFDDIPDAFYQIKRSYQLFIDQKDIRINSMEIDNSYKLYFDNIYETSIIVSKFDPENITYFNLQSKLKFIVLMMIGLYNSKYKKILKKISKKQKNKRYTIDVLETINKFKENNLLNRIII